MIKITEIEPDSIAEKHGLSAGDIILSINGNEINDILDYKFYTAGKILKIRIQEKTESIIIRKKDYDDLGLVFKSYLIDEKKNCKNKCIFCFVDQLPQKPRLRESLYFKDDDERLSFLHGNYVTLTNLERTHIDRIIKMRISPINISVHTTDKDLRVKMMNNKRAGEVLDYIDMLVYGGISINTQIVLCKGVNDGRHLQKTLDDLLKYYPRLLSIAVVPAGLTKYRDGLYPLEPFTSEECKAVIEMVDSTAYLPEEPRLPVYCSDEFYIKAGIDIPRDAYYGDYPQLENGVGMVRLMLDEWGGSTPVTGNISVATGEAIYPYVKQILDCPNINVYKIKNNFFGENITVTGLITGTDLIEQLKDKPLGEMLVIHKSMLRYDREFFLDGHTVADIEQALNIKIKVIDSIGELYG